MDGAGLDVDPVERAFCDVLQRALAHAVAMARAHAFRAPVVTTIEAGRAFYPAEAYHQDFLTLHPTNPYIVYNDLPKVRELQRAFPDLYRAAAVPSTSG